MAIFFITFVAFIIGFILIALLKKTSPPRPQETLRFDNAADIPAFLAEREKFKAKCLAFLEKFNLEYRHSIWADDDELEVDLQDETPVVGGKYLALCLFEPMDNLVGLHKVTGFLETVKGEGASRGIVITTGYFSEEAIRAAEGEPVELVNVVSFVNYLKKFEIYDG
ncbi:MAG: restriction endonuclease [Nitrospinae bacterium]|nr:restriction endonuclease [Nitrospinota bacterium]